MAPRRFKNMLRGKAEKFETLYLFSSTDYSRIRNVFENLDYVVLQKYPKNRVFKVQAVVQLKV